MFCTTRNPCPTRAQLDISCDPAEVDPIAEVGIQWNPDADAWMLVTDRDHLLVAVEFCPWCGRGLGPDPDAERAEIDRQEDAREAYKNALNRDDS